MPVRGDVVSAICRLDLARRRRWWALRAPALAGTRARLLLVCTAAAAAVAALAVAAGTVAALLTPPFPTASALGLVVALAVVDAIQGTSARTAWVALADPDAELLGASGVRGAEILAARLFVLPGLRLGLAAAVLVGAFELGAWLGGGDLGHFAPMWWSVPLLVMGAVVRGALSTLVLRALLFFPATWTGPAFLVGTIALPLILSAAAVLVGRAVQSSSTSLTDQLFEFLAAHVPSAPHVGAAAVVSVALCGGGLLAAPRDASLVQRYIGSGIRFRVGHALPRSWIGAVLAKDLRTMVRRGQDAWITMSQLTVIMPIAASTGVATAMMTDSDPSRGPLGQSVSVAFLAATVIFLIGACSEAVLGLSSFDGDGPVIQSLRPHPEVFGRYVRARICVHAGLLAGLSLPVLLLLQGSRPWPGASMIGLTLTAVAAGTLEACVVVVGSARKPALFRPAVGVAPLEPAVRLAGALGGSALCMVACPVVVGLALLPDLPPSLSLACSLVILVTAPILVGRFTQRSSRLILERSSDGHRPAFG